MTTEEKVLETLIGCSQVTIVTHPLPDGDAIGSSSGLYLYLKELGINNVKIILPTECPQYLLFINREDTIVFESDPIPAKEWIDNSDVLFTLDFNNLKRIGDLGGLIKTFNGKRILIDHHQEPDLSIIDLDLHNTNASSTCELVYQFCFNISKMTGTKITKGIGECLYTGIVTDTGGFKHNTNHNTHQIASDIIRLGTDTKSINNRIFSSSSLSRYKLLGQLLSKTIIVGHVAIIPFSNQDKIDFNYIEGDTEGIVNHPLSCDEIKVSIFLSEKEGYTKMSLRSKEIDVNKLGREFFNGGGHINAAGGRVDLNILETIELIKSVFKV